MASRPRKVAVVTGVDNGACFAVVRILCTQFDDVIITGKKDDHQITSDLHQDGVRPVFYQLDIADRDSLNAFRLFLQEKYVGINLLVHNAATVKYPKHLTFQYSDYVEQTMNYNFFASLSLCRSLWKLLKPHARVCIVMGAKVQSIFSECSVALQSQLIRDSLNMAQLELLMEDFTEECRKGTQFRKGWPSNDFAVSQLGVCLMAAILKREAVDDYRGDIVVTACWPSRTTTNIGCCQIPLTTDIRCLEC